MLYSVYRHRLMCENMGRKDIHQLEEHNYLWGGKKKGEWD